jgi:polyphosphate kinase
MPDTIGIEPTTTSSINVNTSTFPIVGISENITVISIVGMFLEHSRIYYFHHNGEEKLFLSPADMMTRYMENRVEILFPILKIHLKQRTKKWLNLMLKDNVKARKQDSAGEYHYVQRDEDELEVDSQKLLCEVVYNSNNGSPENHPVLKKKRLVRKGNFSISGVRKILTQVFY